MTFCKFGKSIAIFVFLRKRRTSFNAIPALKELTNMAAILDFILISNYVENFGNVNILKIK